MTRSFTTELVAGAHPTFNLERAELCVVAGPDKGEKLRLSVASITIGKSDECELVLRDPAVSSRHARIELMPQGFLRTDLDSKNGISVEGVRVRSLYLTPGMKLKLGSTTLLVKSKSGTDQIPLGAPRVVAGMVAHSVKMRAFMSSLEDVANSEMTVLIQGETGTGKELAAQALHELSPRNSGPFIVYDCGSQNSELAASELFGVRKGAYTGAEDSRPGALVAAEGGTLFLDEIGELPVEMQPILLRALESKESRAIGGEHVRKHNVRIVAATHRNLRELVRAGGFRQDLYYRLAVVTLQIPALRERREDVLPLAQELARQQGAALTPELAAILEGHDWPGNVRELRHMMSRAAISLDTEFVAPQVRASTSVPLPVARKIATDQFERDYLESVLRQSKGNVSEAARIAGVSRQLLTRLISRHGLR